MYRNTKIDNLKGIAIFLVVIGHMIDGSETFKNDVVLSTIYILIYSFHMPLFASISGYLTSDNENVLKRIENILVPFVLFHTFYWLLGSRQIDKILSPAWSTWYLLSLFLWRSMLKCSVKLRLPLVWSVVLALVVGFTKADSFMAISRTIVFFPFFLGGYYYRSNPNVLKFLDLENASRKIIMAGLSIVVAVSFVVLFNVFSLPIDLLYMKAPFSRVGVTNSVGIIFRIMYILNAFVIIVCCYYLVTNKEGVFSRFGRYSCSIYLFHLPVCKALEFVGFFNIIEKCSGIVALFSAILVCCVLCVALGNRFTAQMMNKIVMYGNRFLLKSGELVSPESL